MNSYTTIISQKIQEANSARADLENQLDIIRCARERLNQDETSIKLADQKLLTKIEAWNELMPSQGDDVSKHQTQVTSSTDASLSNREVQKRNRRPSDTWLSILKSAENLTYSELQALAFSLYDVNGRAFRDQIRRYKTAECHLLTESDGKFYLTDKAKFYLKIKDGEASKDVGQS